MIFARTAPLLAAFGGFLLGRARPWAARSGPTYPTGPVRPASGGSLSDRRDGEA
jgi:hypothetical protein